MKTTIFKIGALVLLLTLMGAGCEKDEEDISYLDKNKIFNVLPGFAIYKTKADYFFKVPVTPMQDSFYSPELDEKSALITLYNGKYFYTERFRLNDNYIVSYEVSPNSYFTSLSYDEYVRKKLAPVVGAVNQEVVESIIDRDPFTEFYRSPDSFDGKTWITLDEMNTLIKEKKLETYFTKIK